MTYRLIVSLSERSQSQLSELCARWELSRAGVVRRLLEESDGGKARMNAESEAPSE